MLLSVLLCMGIAAGCLLAGRILLHYFQLESYPHRQAKSSQVDPAGHMYDDTPGCFITADFAEADGCQQTVVPVPG